jgi:3-hydroxyisobutyrate dehydrogenase-like beta-hydroxyacid dehydrogenase
VKDKTTAAAQVGGNVGFIGLGTMGFPMATNLAKAGVQLWVFDTNPAVLQRAAALKGVTVVRSAKDVAQQTEVLFTCLPNDEIVLSTYLGPAGVAEGAHRGLITCDCSTVSPGVTAEIHKSLLGKGINHMDTPMLGSLPQAIEGQIFFIVGGEREALAKIAPYLDILGNLHLHVGPSASGNRIKLIHNGLAAVTAVAVAEALAMAVQSGVDPGIFYEVVRSGGGMAYGTYFERRAKRVLDGDFSPTFLLELMRKDAGLALQLAEQVRVPAPMLKETKATYDEAVEAGWGKEDFSAVTHVIERRIGRKLSSR